MSWDYEFGTHLTPIKCEISQVKWILYIWGGTHSDLIATISGANKLPLEPGKLSGSIEPKALVSRSEMQ